MKKALAQLVRFHPKVSGVWIYAAAWEFDHNLNVTAARALMQSGLRACPTSEDLWVEYLRMELTYLNKLKARKVALGEDEGTLTSDGRCSIEALPTSFSLRTKILEILEATNLAHSEDLRNDILNDMKKDFSKEPKYWDWLARLETTDFKEINHKQLSKAIQVYEESLKIVPSATMFNLYVKFLMDAIKNENGDEKSAVHFTTSGHTVDPISHLQIVFEKAESLGCITEDLACQHVSFLLQLGKSDEAKMLIQQLCTGKFSNAVHLWTLWLSMEMRLIQNKSPSPSKADLSSIFKLLIDVLKKVSISEAENLWLMGLKYFANQRHHFDKLVETSLVLLANDGGSDSGFSLSSAIVKFVLQSDGVKPAREIYKRFLTLPHPGLAIYRNCIELESNLASAGDKSCLQNVRKLYESALATYSQDASLWRDYYSMEVKLGTSETAAAVHWRARKVLKNSNSLLPSTTL
ncbi:RNA-processing protein [Abeliophyllum distichum]|uniref:RNA-processing protein n=1 Tax=Abeliophyllum distichum TaxID=126358 RepID=A0ABD1QL32_9LAMI